MQTKPDVEVIFHFTDDKRNKIYEGYRPAHLIIDGYYTTGVHHYYSFDERVLKGTINFISPEEYQNSLWVGKKIPIIEGTKTVGYATITAVLNPILDRIDNDIEMK